MTEFSFEHVFRAPSAAAVLAAYFDPDHLASQDEVAGLIERTVTESTDDGARLRTSWRVAAREQLPLFARPFVAGGRLRYLETMTWRRADDAIDLLVQPDVLGGRVQVAAEYRLTKVGEGQVLRRYRGSITVAVRLVSGRIERAIAEKMEQGMPAMAACTQAWLDRTPGAG
jgi:hypothetical protein